MAITAIATGESSDHEDAIASPPSSKVANPASRDLEVGTLHSSGTIVAASSAINASGTGSSLVVTSANGATLSRKHISELITLSTSTTITTSASNLLPANSNIRAVTARMVTTITTATTVSIGDPTSGTRFASAANISTSAMTVIGIRHLDPATGTTQALSPVQVAATTVKITMDAVAGAGSIRVTVFYDETVAPTS